MELKDLITSRRTIHRFQPGVLPDEAVLRAAMAQSTWAPNHHLTWPWRFYLLGEQAKQRICLLNAQLVREKQGERAAAIKLRRWRDVPGWLALTCLKSDDALTTQENYASCCCVAQNLSLLLWEQGIGVKWSTGAVTRRPGFYRALGADPALEEVVGLFWYGFPAEIPTARRPPLEQVLRLVP